MADHIQVDDTTPRIAYTATSGQTLFQVPFAFFADADLVVYIDDVTQTLDTDYTVSGSGASEGGSITFASGLTAGEVVVINRTLTVERTTDFPNSGPLVISSLNTELDKLVAMLQQLEDSIARTLRLADSDTTTNLDIPAASERASTFLGFDANGDPTVGSTVTETTVSTFMATVLDDTTAAAARTTLGITDQSAYVGYANWQNFR